MKPNLVLLNGPCGIGKSTLAERYIDDHPLALNLDMDDILKHLGRWRENPDGARQQKLQLAYAQADVHLQAGYDVVVPNILKTLDVERFETIAHACGALLCEFVLLADKDEAIARFIRRGQAEGHTTGFRPGSSLAQQGGVQKLAAMYDGLQVTLQQRPGCMVIEPTYGDIEGTYQRIIASMPA